LADPRENFKELCGRYGGDVESEVKGNDTVLTCIKDEEMLFQGLVHRNTLIINTAPHPINFIDGTTLKGSTTLAGELKARAETRKLFERNGISFITTEFKTDERGRRLVEWARKAGNVILVSSIISVNAYGYPVVSPVITPETARLPPPQRKAYKDRWNTRVSEKELLKLKEVPKLRIPVKKPPELRPVKPKTIIPKLRPK